MHSRLNIHGVLSQELCGSGEMDLRNLEKGHLFLGSCGASKKLGFRVQGSEENILL